MIGPQNVLVFLLLLLGFVAATWWQYRAGHLALRMVAAFCAFLTAAMFGIAAVNRYYGYYQGWTDIYRDMADDSSGDGRGVPEIKAFSAGFPNAHGQSVAGGRLVNVRMTGRTTGLVRQVLVYLPPQYFDPAYGSYKFPAVELLHGSPGTPTDWTRHIPAPQTLAQSVRQHLADPAVLVMPDISGGRRLSGQCLDAKDGPRDETFLTRDVPDYVAATLRVRPPGDGWGLAGYSEGGYCAANLALRHTRTYGVAAVLSGYFQPLSTNRTPSGRRDPFAGDQRDRDQNTPMQVLQRMAGNAHLPLFWLASGSQAAADTSAARGFASLLRAHRQVAPLTVLKGSGHDFRTWRNALRPMFQWMTQHLTGGAGTGPAPSPTRQPRAEGGHLPGASPASRHPRRLPGR
ncbi:alpha/beta hydrolase [Actinomadura harenae]|uniref:Esterase n=1 Tax=Actinomadura harenae TaxID=2483351 RepID=A0A3M2M2V9_9ACTN|nr:alpha/beta hydrolase-fold protein [Actinomadura harenae]RMI43133.1 hypothetical protein EBO15_16960 [Actinomadura harenae]